MRLSLMNHFSTSTAAASFIRRSPPLSVTSNASDLTILWPVHSLS